MLWSDKTVFPILLAQAALAFYYLVLPFLLKVLRRFASLGRSPLPHASPGQEREAEPKASEYRGKWRDAAYTGERSKEKPEPPKQPPPENALRAQYLMTLGLRDPVHLKDVKHAYRSMAKTYHPDRYASSAHSCEQRSLAADKMREVNQAYDWLCSNA